MLTALCTAIPARAGLLAIGGEGALVVGVIATVLVGVRLAGLPFALGVAIMGLAGALAGGLWIGAAGALRQRRGVNETISTLLMNYIAIAILNHLVSGPIRDFDQMLKASSWSIPEHLMLDTLPGLDIHWGLVVGIVLCLLLYLVMNRTTFGFGADILGGNPRAAQLAGLPINRMVVVCCFLGGAGAGLAGAMEIVAAHGFASDSLVVGFGYAGILIAFLRVRTRWWSLSWRSCSVAFPPAAACCSGGSTSPTQRRRCSWACCSSWCSPATRSTAASASCSPARSSPGLRLPASWGGGGC